MISVSAVTNPGFLYPTEIIPIDDFREAFDCGERVVYYAGESLGIAKAKSPLVSKLVTWVWDYVVLGSRGKLHLRKIESRKDGLHRYEYLAIPNRKPFTPPKS